jgi:aldose 1-epimerase
MVVPSGQQLEIVHGEQRATVVEVGGGLRAYSVAGHAVLDGYPPEEIVTGARGQPLVPWPNRLHRGTYTWDGVTYTAPVDEPDKGNALHGFTRWRTWSLQGVDAAHAVARLRLHPLPYYPFTLDLQTDYALDDHGLTVSTAATNAGDTALPFAHGAHPYLTVGTPRVDEAAVQLAAATYLPTDEAQIPTGRAPVEGTAYDLRALAPVGARVIDHAYTDLDRDADGRAWLRLSRADGGREAALWADASYGWLEVFTGDTLPSRQREGLGVEPMSAPPNAFATGEGLLRLEPGESAVLRWGLRAVATER